MTNKYSFQDTGVTHILYQEQMEQFDLSMEALKEFAFALRNGDLGAIKSMFTQLTLQQKKGLLAVELDYSVLDNPFEWGTPRQTATAMAQHFAHEHIFNYLNQPLSAPTLFKNTLVLFPPDAIFPFEEQKDEPQFNMRK
ncbi:hypothetical protein [Legionella fallonii]|uniref:Uncharacterized protein n=1 Tax=Legionella fallonii LLAP-10 TaxID=1212491 RepID=A0A098G127_9GAMM|nr:hypothetical protein [Legionella fallonii]CEG56188.1 protein of unknown function [Legionella fallonii LLAP-10]